MRIEEDTREDGTELVIVHGDVDYYRFSKRGQELSFVDSDVADSEEMVPNEVLDSLKEEGYNIDR